MCVVCVDDLRADRQGEYFYARTFSLIWDRLNRVLLSDLRKLVRRSGVCQVTYSSANYTSEPQASFHTRLLLLFFGTQTCLESTDLGIVASPTDAVVPALRVCAGILEIIQQTYP